MNVLCLHFTHPEGYPPTLNAINCISDAVDQVIVLSTDTLPTNWTYNKNVKLILLEGGHNRIQQLNRSRFKKLKTYVGFTYQILKLLNKNDIDLLVIYDDIPFFFYMVASFFTKKRPKLWYHNHDVYPLSTYKKYKINWLGAASVQKYFNRIDYFSLPAIERKKMFPLSDFKGKFFFIPNYPSKKIIQAPKFEENLSNESVIKVIYPGSPSFKNGFEELIDVMNEKVNDKTITLTIVGDTHSKYQTELLTYAKDRGVEKQVFFVPRISYIEMTHFLKDFHVGWALYKPVDLSVATAGSSSNKIYEFLANGLPIIVFDNEHHKKYLSECKAAFYSDLTKPSILQQLKEIDCNHLKLSKIARNEFENHYQFEFNFEPVIQQIIQEIKPNSVHA